VCRRAAGDRPGQARQEGPARAVRRTAGGRVGDITTKTVAPSGFPRTQRGITPYPPVRPLQCRASQLSGRIVMARTVQCVKLKREAEGLDYAPYPGELGKRIWQSVSKQAWEDWIGIQTRLVNENRLNLADA